MKFDLITVFPEFFSVLDLSLVGKAQDRGIIDVDVHDLRSWTHDVHHTVDDAPFGGGAGMVMKPDVWADAIDSVMGEGKVVLAIPTPSGRPLTQRACEELATADQLIIACGRYEGIDSRVAEYYGERIAVVEYSLGDYVLNGGEVAAVALVEAVSRLLPGMVGNPDSLVEESHGAAGLLEYPVYTRPAEFRGLKVPPVLTSGDHAAVRRWRRDRAIARTALRRPDMIAKLKTADLDKKDRAALQAAGWLVARESEHPQQFIWRRALASDAGVLAALAAETFPDACPANVTAKDIHHFVSENLSVTAFEQAIADPLQEVILAVTGEGEPVGYSLLLLPEGDGVRGIDDGAPAELVLDGIPRRGPLMYLSKFYLHRKWRGSGAFELLMEATLQVAAEVPGAEPYLWLGTNRDNKRAINAYKKAGFTVCGTRAFYVGDERNEDVTLARRLNVSK